MRIFTPCRSIVRSSFLILSLLFSLLWLQAPDAVAQTRTTYWQGSYSSDWNNRSNWTNGVPDANTDVIIGGSAYGPYTMYYPLIDESNGVTVASLTVTSQGATKDVKLYIQNKALLVTVKGNLTITGTAELVNRGTNLVVSGNWLNNGKYTEEVLYTYYWWGQLSNTYYPAVEFAGAGKTVGGTAANSFNHVTVSGSTVLKANLVINPLGTTLSKLEVKGVLDPELNRVIFATAPSDGFVVHAGATIKVKASTYEGNYPTQPTMYTTSTVDYAAPGGTQTIFQREYGILKISGGGVKQLSGNTTVASFSASTQVVVEGGTLDLRAFSLNREGSSSTITGGALSLANGAALRIGGTGSFPAGFATRDLGSTSTVEYYGASQIVSNEAYGNLILSGSGTKTMPAAAMSIAGNLTGTGSASFTARATITVSGNVELGGTSSFNGGNFTHTVGGNWTDNATFTGAGSTVVMSGAGKRISRTAAGAASFNNLAVTGSGISIAAASMRVAGNLSTSGSGSLSQASGGTVIMAGTGKTISGGNITFQNLAINGSISTAAAFEVQGNLAVNSGGSFVATAGTINLTGSGKTITSPGATALTFSGIRVNGALGTASSFYVKSDFSGAGKLTATAGTIYFSGTSTFNGSHDLNNVTVSGSGSRLRMVANANLGIAGAFAISSGAFFDATTNRPSTVTFNGATTQSIPGTTYYNIAFANTGAKTANAAITANGSLAIGAGATFNAGAYSHTVSGNWANSGTFNHGNGTVILAGGADTYITGVTAFGALTLGKASEGNTVTLNNDITTATLNMNSGILMTGENKVSLTSNRTGNGWVVGTVRRTHAFAANTAYAFNGPYVEVRFTSVSGVSDVSVITQAPLSARALSTSSLWRWGRAWQRTR